MFPKILWEMLHQGVKAQDLNTNNVNPYPLLEETLSLDDTSGIAYPSYDPTPPPTPSAPQNRLGVWENGEIEEIRVDPELFASTVITDTDGSTIVPGNPGLGSEDLLSGGPGLDRIIGEDDRVQIYDTSVYPWSAVVLISGYWSPNEYAGCTGWMIGPSTVVTAAHCIYKYASQTYKYDMIVMPGYNTEDPNPLPFGRCAVIKKWVPYMWMYYGDIGYDYGVLWLNCHIGELTGTFGFTTTAGSGIETWEALVGYLGDSTQWTMWTGGGSITSSDAHNFYFDNDTEGGQSGAPVYITVPQCNPCSIAINGHEFDPPTMNQGARIDEIARDVFIEQSQFISRNIYLPIIVY